MQTALAVKRDRTLSIETDERLMEIHLGNWQGKTEDEIKEQHPDQFHLYYRQPELFENPEGENFFDVKNRAEAFLTQLEQETPSGNVLVVTHGVFLKTLYLLCRNDPVEHVWKRPFIYGTSLTIVGIENGRKELLLEGCIQHCGRGKQDED
jgi:probable phosphoglycerate mutase